jgi:hypothetical protein
LDDANRRLAVAQAAEATRVRKEADSRELAGVPNDVASLTAFVNKCKRTSCLVLDDANGRLTAAQAAADRAAHEEKFRSDLAAAGNDVAKLSRFVEDCTKASCAVLPDASRRLADAQAAADRAAREIKFRSDLAAAGNDVAKLSRFVEDCTKASCAVLPEARDLLAKAEDAERVRLARIAELAKPKPVFGFNVIVGYDMNGGDIDSPDFVIRETDAATCLAKCQATNGCIAYSFDKWIESCYLKDKLVSLTLDPRSDTSIRKDQLFPGRIYGSSHFCRYSSLAAIGEGRPPAVSSSTAKACEQSCEIDQTCTAYVFRATDKQCWLLPNTVGRKKGKGYESFTSGVKTEIQCK